MPDRAFRRVFVAAKRCFDQRGLLPDLLKSTAPSMMEKHQQPLVMQILMTPGLGLWTAIRRVLSRRRIKRSVPRAAAQKRMFHRVILFEMLWFAPNGDGSANFFWTASQRP